MDDISRFCMHHGANEAILRALVEHGSSFAIRAYLTSLGIEADPPMPKAEPAQAAKPEPAQPHDDPALEPIRRDWEARKRVAAILTAAEAQGRQSMARRLAHHTSATVAEARGILALLPYDPQPAWGAGPEPVALVPVRPDQAQHPGSQAGIDDVWARAVAAVNRGG